MDGPKKCKKKLNKYRQSRRQRRKWYREKQITNMYVEEKA